jgi:inner membrane transporter RhtA
MMAISAMFSVQLGSALSVGMIDRVGAAGTAWMRLSMGALLFLAIARPRVRRIARGDWPTILALGVATGVMTIAFLGAIERIPLGTAVAIEFLGPLTVAAARSHRRQMLVWPLLALVGVVLVTQPWRGQVEPIGIAFAVAAGTGWGVYILLTQRVGDRLEGITGLAITIPIAAITAGIVGAPGTAGRITPSLLLAAVGLAILLPVLPFALEMLALRRMTHTAFGTLMALEPAFGVILGWLVLGQRLTPGQAVGIGLVVLAGSGAQRGGARSPEPPVALSA